MEPKALRYVLKVAEEKNFSLAAKKLFISQPSLSQFIQNLEEQIGTQLFDRTSSPLQLTYIGELYIRHAKAVLDLQQQFKQQVEDVLDSKRGRVVIGCSPFRSAYLLARMLPSFWERYPNIEVILKEDNTYSLEEMVQDGVVDVAISLLPVDEKRFDYEVLFKERMVLAIPPSHHVAEVYNLTAGKHEKMPVVPLSAFADTPFIRMNKKHKLHEMLFDYCRQAGFEPKIALETESMITAQALAGAGMGATLLPETLIVAEHFDKEPCYVRLSHNPSRTVIAIFRKDRYRSKATQLFLEAIKCPF